MRPISEYDDGELYRLKKLIKYPKVLDIIDNPRGSRSTSQQILHEAFTCAVLKKIVGPDLSKYLEEAFTLCEMVEFRSDVIVLFPRGHRKNEGTAYLLNQPVPSISVFDPKYNNRTRIRRNMKRVLEFIMKLHD